MCRFSNLKNFRRSLLFSRIKKLKNWKVGTTVKKDETRIPDTPIKNENELTKEANKLASKGYLIFPCSVETKRPVTEHGFKDATNDPDQIQQWCDQYWSYPEKYSIAMPTGEVNGFWVLDVDKKTDGMISLSTLVETNGDIETACVSSGGGGQHKYFKYSSSLPVKSKTNLLPGIDIRGDGGYIIVPPSKHASGYSYDWLNKEIKEPPEWLVDILKKNNGIKKQSQYDKNPSVPGTPKEETTAYGKAALENACDELRNAIEGTRNETLNKKAFSIGCLVAGTEIAEQDALQALTDAALSSGLGRRETEKTINSGFSAGKKHPKSAPDKPKSGLDLFDKKKYHFTEVGNSYRFRDYAGEDIKFVPVWNRWIVWDGTRWTLDKKGMVVRKAKKLVKEMYSQAVNIKDEELRKAALKHTMKTEKLKEI